MDKFIDYIKKINSEKTQFTLNGKNILEYFEKPYMAFFTEQIRKKVEAICNFLIESKLEPFDKFLNTIENVTIELTINNEIGAKISRPNYNSIEISLSRGLIRFLTCLNFISLSTINQIGRAKSTDNKLVKLRRQTLESFYIFFDKGEWLNDIEIILDDFDETGFIFSMGFNEEQIIDSAFNMCLDHQLEFIILHELSHAFDKTNEGKDRELYADYSALYLSRVIWSKTTTYHTIFCEFFQLSIFLYLKFYEFFRNSYDNGIQMSKLSAFDHIRIPKYIDSHPPVIDRFVWALEAINKVSETCKYFINIIEYQFDKLKEEIVLGQHDLVPFKRMTAIEMQLFLKKNIINQLYIEGNYSAAEELENKIQITSMDSMYVDKGNNLNPNVWLNGGTLPSDEAFDKLLNRNGVTFFSIIEKKFGAFDQYGIPKEAENMWHL